MSSVRTMNKSEFKKFIISQFSDLIEENDMKALTSDGAMEIWEASMTHKSYTSIPIKNYESLETLGDTYATIFLHNYINELSPDKDYPVSYYTNMKNYWLANDKMYKYTMELGLNKFAQYDNIILSTAKNKEEAFRDVYDDLFESFFGALIKASDNFVYKGLGYTLGYAYFVKFFSNKNILLPEDELISYRGKLKEIYDALKWGDVNYPSYETNEGFVVKVLDRDGNTITKGSGVTLQMAEENGAKKALKILNDQGITIESLRKSRPVDKYVESLKTKIHDFLNTKGVYGPITFVQIFSEKNNYLFEMRTIQDYETSYAMNITLEKEYGNSQRIASINTMKKYMDRHNIPYNNE